MLFLFLFLFVKLQAYLTLTTMDEGFVYKLNATFSAAFVRYEVLNVLFSSNMISLFLFMLHQSCFPSGTAIL